MKHSSHRRRPKLTKTQRRVLRHFARYVAPSSVSGLAWRNVTAPQFDIAMRLWRRGYLAEESWGLMWILSPKGWAALDRGY